MKPLLTTLLLVCASTITLSQEYKATFGKYTGCLRAGGICTITSPPSNSKSYRENNVSIFNKEDGTIIIRIYKEKLTRDQIAMLFEESLLHIEKEFYQFTMEESLPLPSTISKQTAYQNELELKTMEAKKYPTTISDLYIDITIQGSLKK